MLASASPARKADGQSSEHLSRMQPLRLRDLSSRRTDHEVIVHCKGCLRRRNEDRVVNRDVRHHRGVGAGVRVRTSHSDFAAFDCATRCTADTIPNTAARVVIVSRAVVISIPSMRVLRRRRAEERLVVARELVP